MFNVFSIVYIAKYVILIATQYTRQISQERSGNLALLLLYCTHGERLPLRATPLSRLSTRPRSLARAVATLRCTITYNKNEFQFKFKRYALD